MVNKFYCQHGEFLVCNDIIKIKLTITFTKFLLKVKNFTSDVLLGSNFDTFDDVKVIATQTL